MSVAIARVEYCGWPNCYRLSNGAVELLVTADVGPRIISFGPCGGPNLLYQNPEHLGLCGGDNWRIYGGHRLWHSPESKDRSYYPDNAPVAVEIQNSSVILKQPVEETTGIEKEMALSLEEEGSRLQIRHTLTNRGLWELELAPWAITALAGGGCAVAPLNEHSHPDKLLPNRVAVFWPYSDPGDSRLRWEKDHLCLRQDDSSRPLKVGVNVTAGWGGYLLDRLLFVKEYHYYPEALYPDYGVSLEIYTDRQMLELESLGPLARLAPGKASVHVETWSLYGAGSTFYHKVSEIAG